MSKLILVAVLYGLDAFNFALHVPMFGQLIRGLGGSHFFLGIINSSQAVISLLCNPVIGSLSDSKGRKQLLINCLIIGFVGNLLMSLTTSFTVIFISRLICGFASPVLILLKTTVTDLSTSEDEKNTTLGRIGIIDGVMFLLGALLSGFLSELDNPGTIIYMLIAVNYLISIGCFRNVKNLSFSPVSFAFFGIIFAGLASQLPDDRKQKKEENIRVSSLNRAASEIKSAAVNFIGLDWAKYWDIFAVKSLADISFCLFVSNLGLLMAAEYDIVGRNLGMVYVSFSVFSTLANILKMRLKHYLPESNYTKLIYSASISVTAYLLMGLGKPLCIFMLGIALMRTGRALTETILTEVVTSRATAQDKGKVISAFDNLLPFAQFVGPITSGILADRIGERNTILLSVIPTSVAISIVLNRRNKDVKTE